MAKHKDALLPQDLFVDKVHKEEVAEQEEHIVRILGGSDRGGTGTKQLPKDFFANEIQAGNVIPPLYDPMVWAYLMEQHTRYRRLVTSMATNTVGLGFEIIPKRDDEKFFEENRKSIRQEQEEFTEFFDGINPEMPFSEMMTQVKIDEEATGQAYIEVERSRNGSEVVHLWHVPSHTVRAGKPKGNLLKYVQMRMADQSKKVFFKPFGVAEELDASTGKWESEAEVTDRANEIITFKLYTPRSSYYGIPRIVSAAPAIAGSRLAQLRNVSFFENDATPRLAIIVNGGTLDEKSMKLIEEFVDSRGKGPGNAGRLMLLQGQVANKLLGSDHNLDIKLMPLTVGVQDDASFTRYLQQNNEEIREAFGIGQIFIGTSDDVNRAVALAMKQLTVEQIFEPEARRYEHRINQCVMRTNGARFTKFRFRRPKTIDMAAESQAYSMLAAAGGVTPNQIQEFLGKPKFNGAWADTPLPILRAGLIEDDTNETETLKTKYGLENIVSPDVEWQVTQQREAQAEAMAAAAGRGEQPHLSLALYENAFGKDGSAVLDRVQSIAQALEAMGFSVAITPPTLLE